MRRLFSVREAAQFLRVSKSWLDKKRVEGGGPRFVRVTSRCVRYDADDLDEWIRSRTFESTSDRRRGDRGTER